jgi:hypothetical protein
MDDVMDPDAPDPDAPDADEPRPGGADDTSNDGRTAAESAADQLQQAALDAITAARTFLDAVEDLVADRSRLQDAAATLGDLVRDGVSRLTNDVPTWADRTWPSPPGPSPGGDDPPPSGGASADRGGDSEPDPGGAGGKGGPGPTRPGGRVRRIPVD